MKILSPQAVLQWKRPKEVQKLGAKVVAYAALANRGICNRYKSPNSFDATECKLDCNLPLFALEDFVFETYTPEIVHYANKAVLPLSPEVAVIRVLNVKTMEKIKKAEFLQNFHRV